MKAARTFRYLDASTVHYTSSGPVIEVHLLANHASLAGRTLRLELSREDAEALRGDIDRWFEHFGEGR